MFAFMCVVTQRTKVTLLYTHVPTDIMGNEFVRRIISQPKVFNALFRTGKPTPTIPLPKLG